MQLTWQQWKAIGNLRCVITSVTIHPHSGAATVSHGSITMAIIEQDGTKSYAYRFPGLNGGEA